MSRLRLLLACLTLVIAPVWAFSAPGDVTVFNVVNSTGWNQSGNEADLQSTDALLLRNYSVNQDRKVQLRKGYKRVNTVALPNNARINSIMELIKTDGSRKKIVGTSNGEIYELTDNEFGNPLFSGLTGERLYWVNFNNKLVFGNGSDSELQYDGDTVIYLPGNDSGAPPPKMKTRVTFHGRIFGHQKGTATIRYCALDSETEWAAGPFANDAGFFNVATVFSSGDELITIGEAEEYIVIHGRRNTAIYDMGSDKRFLDLAKTIKGQGAVMPNGNLSIGVYLMWTRYGIKELTKVVSTGELELSDNISAKIDPYLAERVQLLEQESLEDSVYWVHDPANSRILILMPYKGDVTKTEILGYNYFSGVNAWFQWRHPSPFFSLFVDADEKIFAGGEGVLYELDSGNDDDGQDITAIFELAPQYFGNPNITKIMTEVISILQADDATSLDLDLTMDFGSVGAEVVAQNTLTLPASGLQWDLSWDWSWGLGNIHSISTILSGQGRSVTPKFSYTGRVPHKYIFLGWESKEGNP